MYKEREQGRLIDLPMKFNKTLIGYLAEIPVIMMALYTY
jgi:hypothetical protein